MKEEAAAEATDKEASGAKQDSASSQVKEEASKEAAGGAAPSIAAASIPNGDKVRATDAAPFEPNSLLYLGWWGSEVR